MRYLSIRHVFILLSIATPFLLAPLLLGGVYSHINHNTTIATAVGFFSILYSLYHFISKKRLFVPNITPILLFLILIALLQLIPLPKSIFFGEKTLLPV